MVTIFLLSVLIALVAVLLYTVPEWYKNITLPDHYNRHVTIGLIVVVLVFITTIFVVDYVERKNEEERQLVVLVANKRKVLTEGKMNLELGNFDEGRVILFNFITHSTKDSFTVAAEMLLTEYKNKIQHADSIFRLALVKKDSLKRLQDKATIKDYNKWLKTTKAGKIKAKHPEWTDDDCERLARKEVWIGMTIGMVKQIQGLPDDVSISDYGNGKQFQWCWFDFRPSCFYGNSDGIVTSYN